MKEYIHSLYEWTLRLWPFLIIRRSWYQSDCHIDMITRKLESRKVDKPEANGKVGALKLNT